MLLLFHFQPLSSVMISLLLFTLRFMLLKISATPCNVFGCRTTLRFLAACKACMYCAALTLPTVYHQTHDLAFGVKDAPAYPYKWNTAFISPVSQCPFRNAEYLRNLEMGQGHAVIGGFIFQFSDFNFYSHFLPFNFE